MRLINKTGYRTDDLRRFLLAAHESMSAPHEGKTVTVREGRSSHHGRASLWGGWMMISIPPPGKENIKTIAQVTEHEIAHNLGVRHSEMDIDVLRCRQEISWLTPEIVLRENAEQEMI